MSTVFSNLNKQELLEHRASVIPLVAANMLPLLGVLIFGWSTFEIVLLYWFENVVLGVINVLKMVTCSPDVDQLELDKLISAHDQVDAKIARKQIEDLGKTPWLMHGLKLFFVSFLSFITACSA